MWGKDLLGNTRGDFDGEAGNGRSRSRSTTSHHSKRLARQGYFQASRSKYMRSVEVGVKSIFLEIP